MNEIFESIGAGIGEIVDAPLVQLGIRIVGIYVVVVWLAAAYWAFRDMEGRSSNVVAPYATAAMVILFTPILFPAALLIHVVVRPGSTLAEHGDEELRRQILEIGAHAETCPGCRRVVRDAWLICPSCSARLRRACPCCDRTVALDWDVCAWCGEDFGFPAQVVVDAPGTDEAFEVPLRRRPSTRRPSTRRPGREPLAEGT